MIFESPAAREALGQQTGTCVEKAYSAIALNVDERCSRAKGCRAKYIELSIYDADFLKFMCAVYPRYASTNARVDNQRFDLARVEA